MEYFLKICTVSEKSCPSLLCMGSGYRSGGRESGQLYLFSPKASPHLKDESKDHYRPRGGLQTGNRGGNINVPETSEKTDLLLFYDLRDHSGRYPSGLLLLYEGSCRIQEPGSVFQSVPESFQPVPVPSFFSDHWLSQMETDNRLIRHIEENGDPIFFPGAWDPATDRETLIQSALEQASLEGLSGTSLSPGSARQTPLFYLTGNSGDYYCGMALQSATENGEKTLLVLQDITQAERQTLFQGLFFAGAGILGFLLLGLVSWKFVGKTLVPLRKIKKNRQNLSPPLPMSSALPWP